MAFCLKEGTEGLIINRAKGFSKGLYAVFSSRGVCLLETSGVNIGVSRPRFRV